MSLRIEFLKEIFRKSELDKILEYFHRDFDELQQMDTYWENCNEIEKKVILLLQPKIAYQEGTLSEYWVELFKNSAYIHWIDQTEKEISSSTKDFYK